MTTYAIHATITTHDGGYAGARSVPIFQLDSGVQGIVSARHAARIAAQIINPLGTIPTSDLNVAAYPVAQVPDGTYECEAQNLTTADRIASALGETFSPPREIVSLNMSDRGEGWVWVMLGKHPHDRSPGAEWRTLRLGIYETVRVAGTTGEVR